MNGEIIHENFWKLFHYIVNQTQHATLKCCWGIAQTERHSAIGKSPKWIYERGLLLVLWTYANLIVP